MFDSLLVPKSSGFLKDKLIKLSWKQKLTAITILTLVGLVVVAGFAFVGLNSVNNSTAKQQRVAEYKQRTLTFSYDLLSLEFLSTAITADNIDKFSVKVTSLVDSAHAIENGAASLGYSDIVRDTQKLTELAEGYKKARENWRKNREALGFTETDGVFGRIFKALALLERQSFSMIQEDVSTLVAGQKSYLVTRSSDDESKIDRALRNLETVVVDMDWGSSEIGKSVSSFREYFTQAQELVRFDREVLGDMNVLFEGLNLTTKKLNQFLDDTVIQQVIAEAQKSKASATKIIFAAVFIVGLVIFLSLGSIARQLNLQINKIQSLMKKAAGGDFSLKLSTNNNEKDEFTQLCITSNRMIADIASVVSRVVEGNLSLQEIRDQLEEAVKNLRCSSAEVEKNTQQSTVATQQISIAVNDVAKRSVNVNETAKSASQSTQQGGKVVNECVDSMEKIMDMMQNANDEVSRVSQSSTEMLGIIDVINGLADQTNLLALNAAIESARAGEAGRGFSVVADEVRALAQKTVKATSSISDIIRNFNGQSKRMGVLMEQGVLLARSGQDKANNAMSSFENVEQSIQQVAEEMDQMVVAVEEISYNTNDIAKQVEHIFEQSENVKTTREVLEMHTHELSTQAEMLSKSTSRFILPESNSQSI